jgi:hypothetical protein
MVVRTKDPDSIRIFRESHQPRLIASADPAHSRTREPSAMPAIKLIDRHGSRRGFTLFEVAISLALVAFGVVSVLMLFPMGIKAEQMSRLRLYAGVKAEEIIESFADSSNANPTTETEAPDTWEVPAGYRVNTPDLESRICTHRFGIMPVPASIAQRLDSDGDEIHQILSEGGQLYYSQASGTTGVEEVTQGAVAQGADQQQLVNPGDNQTQRLVFAVAGYAQSNNVAFLAWKDWPYYEPYPSPPGHGEKRINSVPSDSTALGCPFTYNGCRITLWEGVGTGGADNGAGTTDGEIGKVFAVGFKPYALGGSNDLPGATKYLQSALWYADRKGLPATVYAPGEPFAPKTMAAANLAAFRAIADADKWKWVQALRFLSHAATCMTRWKSLEDLGGQPSTSVGVDIASVTIDGGSPASPAVTLTHDKIVYYHELCLQTAMLYAASLPYDWGAPRPTQRGIMMDYPLIEWDLSPSAAFPMLTGTIGGTTEAASQWRPVAAHAIANIGRSYTFADTPIPASRWGDPANFTLCARFAAAERCRQLVFWAVDWLGYEDCETAPSAPVDASKYLFAAPQSGASMATRMGLCTWPDHHVYQYRNPEKVITFTDAGVPGLPTGSDVRSRRLLNNNGEGWDKGSGSDNISRFNGLWGADRNFDGRLDRGPIPRSVRMRAVPVARYNFYDPRLTLKVR